MASTAPPPPPVAKPSRWRHLRFHGLKPSTSSVASSSTPPSPYVLKQGFLLKKGHRLPTTKERFFELRPHVLSYFRSKQSADAPLSPSASDARRLRGVIELDPTDLITPMATSRHWFLLQKLHGPDGKSYKLELRASSPEERQEWIDALRAAARDASVAAAPLLTAYDAERERQLTRTLTMLRVRDATLLSTVLRHDAAPPPPTVDLRASFQVFHELVVLQSLVTQIRESWGPPSTWTWAQYDALVESIGLAEHHALYSDNTVVSTARALQYAFEEVPANQQQLLARRDRAVSSVVAAPVGRLRCPTIYSYLSTFERLAPPDESSDRSSSVSSSGSTSARSSLTPDGPLSPRSATLAKYAHLYLEEEGRQHKPWTWDRNADDDLVDDDAGPNDLAQRLAHRFERDAIYAYVRHHTLLCLNPQRVLKTSKFTSIYDEHVVLAYAQTPFATTALAPHPFAMAKQALFRLFYQPRQSIVLVGDSGSGKTEVAKELLKYVVLTASPASTRRRVVLYTSSTKSTFQMRNDETRTLDLLHAKGITDYDVVLLDLTPDQWPAMTRISKSKRLPQVHVDGLFFGYYETLQRLEDEEQLRMYVTNPLAATKLSAVLDSNILLEAFAHAATPLNANSSRYAKRVELQLAFGADPTQYQVVGCAIAPFLLEKSRVTSASHQRNFHVLYALVHGLNNGESETASLAKALFLDARSSASFRYLGTSTDDDREAAWTRTKDTERFQHIVAAMETVGIDGTKRDALFRVLSAVLWLGNLDFDARNKELGFSGTAAPSTQSIATVVTELLALGSEDTLASLLLRRRVDMAATNERFDVLLSRNQARHARDTLARFLYETAFDAVVAQLNATTASPADVSVKTLSLVDLFGFEAFDARNSLEQLCINYLTEKLAVAERQLVALRYETTVSDTSDDAIVRLFEHPLGIFATLEEQTVLHQSDDVDTDDQKKNELFVRYLYQRQTAALVPQPSQLKQHALRFIVPHTRAVVTYDAMDFVAKNADFVPATLASALEAATQHDGIRAMYRQRASKTGSLTSQFRTQIQQQVSSLHDALSLHCFRANASPGWTSAPTVDVDVVQRQLRAHGVPSILHATAACHDDKAFEVAMPLDVFQTRFQCLAVAPSESLATAMETLLRHTLVLDNKPLVRVGTTTVHLRTLQVAETLELLLTKRRIDAATKLQALARMLRARKWYHALQADRRDLTRALLEVYGPNNTRKIEKTLRKYENGRESELRAKIAAKKRENEAIAAIAHGLEAFFVGTGMGGLDVVLKDREIQRQLAASDDRIVAALREMSLDPHKVLPRQLADPTLRAFYERMLALLQTQTTTTVSLAAVQETDDEDTLEQRVTRLVATHKSVWRAVAGRANEAWTPFHDRLDEIGDEPEMLLFYADDDAFNEALGAFVSAVQVQVQAGGVPTPSDATEDDVALLVQQLQSVAFTATLMAAMQGDPFFVDALQSPPIVAAVHQLMTDRTAFAADALRAPLLREFFHRLVRLSEETRKH